MTFDFILLDATALSTIALRFIDDKDKEYLLKTPLRIASSKWDAEKQRPYNIYLKKYKKLHTRLNKIRIGIATYLRDIKTKQRMFSINTLGRIIKKHASLSDHDSPDGSLLKHMETYINNRLHIISASTYKRYMVFFRLLQRFEGHRMQNLHLNDLNGAFVKDFLTFGELEEYSKSTIYRTIHFVRTILNFLEKRGIRTLIYELELPKEKKFHQIVTLTEDELKTIKKTDVPIHLKAAKDWLVISCYTGQRISDFMNFNIEMMEVLDGRPCMSFVQKKTQKEILLALHPAALVVMSKNNNSFPSKLSTQRYNDQIKEVVHLAGIKSLVKVRKRQGFRAYEMMVQKWEAITSHIGRRSFASNFYGKIPTPLLMEATGHSTEQMFQRYISSVDTERTRNLGIYFEETYKETLMVT
jgi:site-specific recombinase XerD